jgi:hypothetical protein
MRQIALSAAVVVFESEAILITASQQAGTRRAAHWRCGVAVGEAHNLRADPVNVWSLEAVNFACRYIGISGIVGRIMMMFGWGPAAVRVHLSKPYTS